MIKEIAAFTENNIRPLVDEANSLIDKIEEAGFKLNQKNLRQLIKEAGLHVLINTIVNGVVKITVVVLICEAVLRALQL